MRADARLAPEGADMIAVADDDLAVNNQPQCAVEIATDAAFARCAGRYGTPVFAGRALNKALFAWATQCSRMKHHCVWAREQMPLHYHFRASFP